jgi:hypothetical protein
MSRAYTMKVLIDEDLYPDLYAKLSEARHSRARAEMLRRLASTCLKLENGQQPLGESRNAAQGHVPSPVSATSQPRTTKNELSHSGPAAAASTTASGLTLPTNASNAIVTGLRKYLA